MSWLVGSLVGCSAGAGCERSCLDGPDLDKRRRLIGGFLDLGLVLVSFHRCRSFGSVFGSGGSGPRHDPPPGETREATGRNRQTSEANPPLAGVGRRRPAMSGDDGADDVVAREAGG